MKKATCRDVRGACDAKFQGETAEEMGANCRQHVMEMMQLRKEEQEKWYEDFRSRFDSLQDA